MSVTERLHDYHLRARNWPNTVFASKPRLISFWIAVVFAGLVLLAVLASFFIDEPLRRRMEANLNRTLKGYTVRIGRLDFHPVGLSLDLENLLIIQNENPEPPVAQFANLSASVHWRALLHGRLVADFVIDSPKLYLNRKQAKQEIDDPVPMKERGWQQALQEIYPLKINRFEISNGSVVYVDDGPFRPLELSHVAVFAENIRNVRSDPDVYPSPFEIQATVFERGRLHAEGHADFLAEPYVAFKSDDVALENIELGYFKPILDRYQISVRQGSLSTHASIEYGPEHERIDIPELMVDNVDAEYVHKSAEPVAKKVAAKVDESAKKYSDSPQLTVNIDRVRVRGKLGFANLAGKPPYRVFWTDVDALIAHFTNQSREGVMTGKATGKFMGSGGATEVTFTARPNPKGPDFDLRVAIADTDMRLLNDLWRAYGNFDVVGGLFSFYCELTVRDGIVQGYVKPLFYKMDVFDRRQDKEKSLFRKLYEGVIGGLSWLLRNTPRKEVATTVPVHGKLNNPQTSTLDTILGLVQNAFFKAILPGFEREVASRQTSKPRG
jgi:hypothetical protein